MDIVRLAGSAIKWFETTFVFTSFFVLFLVSKGEEIGKDKKKET